jgi:dipeptide/tripeptide permease
MFFTALVGGFIGDAYLGRLWTVVLFLIVYALVLLSFGFFLLLELELRVEAFLLLMPCLPGRERG